MPSIGDTSWGYPPDFEFGETPEDSASGVSVDLVELEAAATIREYYDHPTLGLGWWTGGNIGPVTINSAELIESPNIDEGAIAASRPLLWAVQVNVPIDSSLNGETVHTWKVRINVAHGTATFGAVSRTYDSPEFTFTTGVGPSSTPTLTSPSDGAINQSINTDWLKEMMYDDADAESRSAYTVYFSFDGGFSFFAQDDRSRYSILSYKMFLGVTLDYSTTYYWFVRKDFNDEITDSDVWSFTTIDYQPPALRTRQKIPYGGGAPITVPTGENNMMSVNRLIVAGDDRIFYEDV